MRRLWIVGLALIAVSLIGGAVSPAAPASWSGTPSMHGDGPSGWWGQMGEHHAWMHDSSQGSAAIPGVPEVTVVATEFAFDPLMITARGAVNITLVNQGSLFHDLTIPALGVRVVARPGEQSTVGLSGVAAGVYEIVCSVPGHADAGMVGTLEVTG